MPSSNPNITTGFGRREGAVILLTLPSGARVEAQRPGVQGLIAAGILDSLDTLTEIVQNEVIPVANNRAERRALERDGNGDPKVDIKALMADPERVKRAVEIMDKITIHCVVNPSLLPVPIPLDEHGQPIPEPTHAQIDALRTDEDSYVDFVDAEDKTYLMNWALGGTKDMEEFRSATEKALGGLHNVEADGTPT